MLAAGEQHTLAFAMAHNSNFESLIMGMWPFSGEPEDITFQSAGTLTLGVEIELQLIDRETLNLTSRSEELLKAAASKKIKPEFYLSTVEINTDKCCSVQEIKVDLSQSLEALATAGKKLGIVFSTTGCHPFSRYADCVITPSSRYHELIDRNQWLTRRMTVYGMHVHVGMSSGEDCIRFHNFFLHFMPHLLALSASSPFWQGEDTGLAACRPSTYEALPTAGQPYPIRNWREYETLYYTLRKCDAIQSLKDLWWDMRPSPGYGTLEIRVCDGLATLAEAVGIVAFVHVLAHWFSEHGNWIDQVPPPPPWVARENKWRVMRYGLDAELVTHLEGDTKNIRQDIEDWLIRLDPYIQKLHYHSYVKTLRGICTNGNSSARQRAVYAQTQSLREVVKHNIREFTERTPLWDNKNDNTLSLENFI
jgi:carboxylate-amine ligase